MMGKQQTEQFALKNAVQNRVKIASTLSILLGLLLTVCTKSYAGVCTSPAGTPGQFQYFSDNMFICSDSKWAPLGRVVGGPLCTLGQVGKMQFNTTYYGFPTIELCSYFKGSYIYASLKNEQAGTCMSTPAGTFEFDKTLNNPRFCDGTSWYNMRSPRQIRISITTTDSAFGGQAAADAICQADANTTAYGGTWVAWVSTSTVNAKDKILDNGPWYNENTKIADDKADLLDGSLDGGINKRFDGTTDTTSNLYTGTISNGTAAANLCSDWTDNTAVIRTPSGQAGLANKNGAQWTANSSIPCNTTLHRLLCFQL